MKPLFRILTLAALLGSTSSAVAFGATVPAVFDAPDAVQPAVADDDSLRSGAATLWLVDGDEGDGDDDEGDDDDDDEGDDDDDDDDDCGDGGCGGSKRARNPAKSGTVAPPENGLFGNGQAPKVNIN